MLWWILSLQQKTFPNIHPSKVTQLISNFKKDRLSQKNLLHYTQLYNENPTTIYNSTHHIPLSVTNTEKRCPTIYNPIPKGQHKAPISLDKNHNTQTKQIGLFVLLRRERELWLLNCSNDNFPCLALWPFPAPTANQKQLKGCFMAKSDELLVPLGMRKGQCK